MNADDQYGAAQFLFYADTDDMPAVGEEADEDFTVGDSVVWCEDNMMATVDFDDEVVVLAEEHGLAIVDEEDAVEYVY